MRAWAMGAVVAVLAATAGCGVASSAADGVELEVVAAWTGLEAERFEEVLSGFTEATGITVRYNAFGDDGDAVLTARIETGRPPDVAVLPQPGLLHKYAGNGALVPLTGETAEAVQRHYDAVWTELGSVDGILYGVWFKAANKSLIWYRPSVFVDAGLVAPRDWEGLVSAAAVLREQGTAPFALAAGDAWTLTDWFENVYLHLAGPDAYDRLLRHEIPWTDPTVLAALEVLTDLWAADGAVPGGAQGALGTTFPASVEQVFGAHPEAAMVYEGDFVAAVIDTLADPSAGSVADDVDNFPFPVIDGSAPAVVGGGDVAVQLVESDAASRLMAYLASPEAPEPWVRAGGFTSPNRDVGLDAYPDAPSRRYAEALTAAGNRFRFDMSDLAPPEFGGTPGQGQWRILQELVVHGDVEAAATQLEVAAARAYR